MISIASKTYDPLGFVTVSENQASSRLGDFERRVSRDKTLDGGCVIYDGGFSHGDRTFEIYLDQPTLAEIEQLKYLHMNYADLLLMCEEGAFSGTIETITQRSGGDWVIRFLVKDKESA